MVHEYREGLYQKGRHTKASKYGELNQTRIMSYWGLNNVKHRVIIDDVVDKGLIERFEEPCGNNRIIKYKFS